jgi:hypothetical protein
VIFLLYFALIHPTIASLSEEVTVDSAQDLSYNFKSQIGAVVQEVKVTVSNNVAVTVYFMDEKNYASGDYDQSIKIDNNVTSFKHSKTMDDGKYYLVIENNANDDASAKIEIRRTMFRML